MKEKDNLKIKEKLTRSLIDVVTVDYFATQKLIREIFVAGFDTKQFDADIKNAYLWVGKVPKDLSILASPDLPDYVKKNRFTVGLYMELAGEIEKNKVENLEPVAFGLASRGLRDDLEAIKNSTWYKTKGENSLVDQDLLSFVIFTKYWHVLNNRAKILLPRGNF